MATIEIVEIYGIRINRKEAALLRILFENNDSYYRAQAWSELEKLAGPETLEYIITNHPDTYYKSHAMAALRNL